MMTVNLLLSLGCGGAEARHGVDGLASTTRYRFYLMPSGPLQTRQQNYCVPMHHSTCRIDHQKSSSTPLGCEAKYVM